MLDPIKLATLREVVRAGSFSGAAETLGLTQPAVSRQIALLERQAHTQLLRRTPRGVQPTEAGRLLTGHADGILASLTLAEAQLAELAGLRSGRVRLGSFLTALVQLSSELATLLEARHPELFQSGNLIEDELVDRATAFERLTRGQLDVAIVFEHAFEPSPAPETVELVPLFDDYPCALLPRTHRLAGARSVHVRELADDTWIQAHHGSAAQLVDEVLATVVPRPRIVRAGGGDEPLEAQAFIANGTGVTAAHQLNVVLSPERMRSVPLAERTPVRHVQAAIMANHHAPAPRAVVAALREIGQRRRPLSVPIPNAARAVDQIVDPTPG